ncbi:MAG: response regulator [Myxococcaceae bacterium]|nr:response regulator [Myxococcaceae bacterium]
MKTPSHKKPAPKVKAKAGTKARARPGPHPAAKKAKEVALRAPGPAPTASSGKAPLVLVVDDYEDAREMYSEYLQFSGFRTAEAKTGVEALKQATALLPDIILMDLSLPEMDGWEATRRLKAAAKTRHIPVVALTGHALAGHSDSAKEAGCDAFVAKPCLPEDLVVEVRRLLSENRNRKITSRVRAPGAR